ncbi:MFS transporter [Sessilibacter sp. MAH1]
MSDASPQPKKENMLVNLAFNIILPTFILIKLSKEQYLGPTLGLVLALAFPIVYGIWDYVTRSKFNLFSAIGIVSILLTGGISLLELDPKYIAIKEASIPGILAIIALVSAFTPYPFIRTIFFNETVVQVDKIKNALAERNNEAEFDKTLKNATFLVALSFVVSSVLNYLLAKWIVISPPGTEEYNSQLGKMQILSYPVIVLPATVILIVAMYYLFRNVTRLTGLTLEDLFAQSN